MKHRHKNSSLPLLTSTLKTEFHCLSTLLCWFLRVLLLLNIRYVVDPLSMLLNEGQDGKEGNSPDRCPSIVIPRPKPRTKNAVRLLPKYPAFLTSSLVLEELTASRIYAVGAVFTCGIAAKWLSFRTMSQTHIHQLVGNLVWGLWLKFNRAPLLLPSRDWFFCTDSLH